MPRVDRVEPSKHVKGRYLVFLDSGTLIKAGEQELLDFGLRPGLVLEEEELNRLLTSSQDTAAKARAAKMIGARPLSKQELMDRLVSKGEGASSAQKAADWLEDLGAVNDVEYAKTIVRHYDRMGYGPQKIPKDCWDEAMQEARPQREVVAEFLVSKFRYREITDKELQRQTHALRRRGFSWDAIREEIQGYAARTEKWDEMY